MRTRWLGSAECHLGHTMTPGVSVGMIVGRAPEKLFSDPSVFVRARNVTDQTGDLRPARQREDSEDTFTWYLLSPFVLDVTTHPTELSQLGAWPWGGGTPCCTVWTFTL